MKKKILSFIIVGIFVVFLVGAIGNVSAEEIVSTPESIPFSFTSWFQHTFNIYDFSIVGDYRQCDRYPEETLYAGYIEHMDIDISDYCSSGHGLIDVFDGDWSPWMEFKDDLEIYCYITEGCIYEIYCCDFDECDRDSDCEDWYGDGSECKTKLANDPNIDYEDNNFNYCTEPEEIEITCYYYPGSGSSCSSRTYIGDEECPDTYMGIKLYESKSTCVNNICISHSTYTCYYNDVYWYDSCGVKEEKKEDCGTDGCSGGVCITNGINFCPFLLTEFLCNLNSNCEWYGGILGLFQGCIEKGEGVCATGETDCDGTNYLVCENSNWVNKGEVDGKCGYVPTTCQSGADTNNDGVVSRSELGVYINKWISGTITRTKLGQTIMEWVDGC